MQRGCQRYVPFEEPSGAEAALDVGARPVLGDPFSSVAEYNEMHLGAVAFLHTFLLPLERQSEDKVSMG